MRLTARGVAALRTDEPQAEFWDDVVPGLALRVGRGGTKTYIVRYRANGRHRRLTLGKHPRLSLADARDAARKALAQVAAGEDPSQDRQVRRSTDTTFRAMADEVMEAKAERTRDNTRRQYRQVLDAELLPAWGDRPVSSIGRRDVVQLIERIARRAPVQANRALATVKVLFNAGLEREFPTLEANPAHRLKPLTEAGRDRYLTRDEIRAVWKALEWEPPLIRVLFRVALLTAQRIGSVCALRWSDIDDADVWRIPPGAFKGKREHWVPLSKQALAALAELRPLTGEGEYVFPGRSDGTRPHLTNWNNALRRIRGRTDIPAWNAHDFRTTFRTWATRAAKPAHKRDPAGLGVAPHVADACLGHAEASLGYSRYTGERASYLLAEKRAALKLWGAFVAAAVKETD